MSKAALVIKSASMILALGLSSSISSGTAWAEGELGHAGEWPDAAYSESPDDDWSSALELSAITDVLRQAWAGQMRDADFLRLSVAQREALLAEAEAERQIAAERGELAIHAAQAQEASDMVSGALSIGAGVTGVTGTGSSLKERTSPQGPPAGSSPKGGTTGSPSLRSERTPTSP